ncbi:hypothetical protein [Marinicella sp. W31]|uniref:hypothetical protein n=1 Tax=Marinicella sp. W31 TaxID=3023713 RepID=UPI00375847A9
MKKIILTLLMFVFCFAKAKSEFVIDTQNEIVFEIYELTTDGRKLLHKGEMTYDKNDIFIHKQGYGDKGCINKRLILWNDFGLSSCLYTESEIDGFGMSIDKDWDGFSWEWFNHTGNCDCDEENYKEGQKNPEFFQKLQGSGEIKVEFIEKDNKKEITSFKFLSDVTMRLELRSFLIFSTQYHILIKKGSMFSFK